MLKGGRGGGGDGGACHCARRWAQAQPSAANVNHLRLARAPLRLLPLCALKSWVSLGEGGGLRQVQGRPEAGRRDEGRHGLCAGQGGARYAGWATCREKGRRH